MSNCFLGSCSGGFAVEDFCRHDNSHLSSEALWPGVDFDEQFLTVCDSMQRQLCLAACDQFCRLGNACTRLFIFLIFPVDWASWDLTIIELHS